MSKYTFRSHKGNDKAGLVTVEAEDEVKARRLAMEKHHEGVPLNGALFYEGAGLHLISKEG